MFPLFNVHDGVTSEPNEPFRTVAIRANVLSCTKCFPVKLDN